MDWRQRCHGNEAGKDQRQQPRVAVLEPQEQHRQAHDQEEDGKRKHNLNGQLLCERPILVLHRLGAQNNPER